MVKRRSSMPNCGDDLMAFHTLRVALPASWLGEMRAKRDKVRALITRRLRNEGISNPIRFRMQGSVAMGTIIRGGNYGSYDIDDGLYLTREALTGARGADTRPLAVRQLVCSAAGHGNFAEAPKVKRNCVRIFYASGFHVDVPTYRVTTQPSGADLVELAAGEWRATDPQGVTNWFRAENGRSPGMGRQRQLLRVVQYAKVWAKARAQPQGSILGGFGITVLVVDAFVACPERDDVALYDTLTAMLGRLRVSTSIPHPVLPDAVIPQGGGDAPVRVLRRCLEDSMGRLKAVTRTASRDEALRHWDRFFHENFFSGR